jgi:hypothetical protein
MTISGTTPLSPDTGFVPHLPVLHVDPVHLGIDVAIG